MDAIKIVAAIVLIVGLNLAWISLLIWLGANIVKGVFGS